MTYHKPFPGEAPASVLYSTLPEDEGVIIAATDGSSLGNPGPSGWCWYVSETCWEAGGFQRATNNIAELSAVLHVLNATAGETRPLEIRADSQYTIDCLTKWIFNWQSRGWKNAKGESVKNQELIEEIYKAMKNRDVRFVKVKAHTQNGDRRNVAADLGAVAASNRVKEGSTGRTGPGWKRV